MIGTIIKKHLTFKHVLLGLITLFVLLTLCLEYGGHILYGGAVRQMREAAVACRGEAG